MHHAALCDGNWTESYGVHCIRPSRASAAMQGIMGEDKNELSIELKPRRVLRNSVTLKLINSMVCQLGALGSSIEAAATSEWH